MSSATSISRTQGVPLPGDSDPNPPAGSPAPPTTGVAPDDAGFRPWHFFVLASLVAATAAVILSRRSSPEHLILLSLVVGAAGAAAAAFYRTLAPLAAADASIFRDSLSMRMRAALEREKSLVLRSLKELEFDKAMGKLSTRDFDEMSGRLRARAIALMKQLDDEKSGYRTLIERELQARLRQKGEPSARPEVAAAPARLEPAPAAVEGSCASCGTINDTDAAFCKRCGQRVA